MVQGLRCAAGCARPDREGRPAEGGHRRAGVAGSVLFEPGSVRTRAGGHSQVLSPFCGRSKAPILNLPCRGPGDCPRRQPGRRARMSRTGTFRGRFGAACPWLPGMSRLARTPPGTGWQPSPRKGWTIAANGGTAPAEPAKPRLSGHLAWGEISPATCRHAAARPAREGRPGAVSFLKELAWREFAYHLAWHTPWILDRNWREVRDRFPWSEDEGTAEVRAWRQGRTGVRPVDAGMRELYVTGYMRNRARLIVAIFLTKHLMTHWRVGKRWFEECLTDWDPASNAMGWRWTAGCGAIFPDLQSGYPAKEVRWGRSLCAPLGRGRRGKPVSERAAVP